MHRVCAVGLCSVLVAGAGTPVAWGETPEERCKRETESYNRLWQDAWVRNHPKEVAKGQQPPSPTPPYRCFGNDNPQQDMPGYTPPPGATIPPAGSAPGSGAPADTTPNSGGGAGEGASPGFLPESPNPLDDPAAGSDSYPYGSSYQDTWNSRRNHTPPSSSPATGNSPATAHGNGESATGNGLTGRGNGVNPKGTPPHSTPPANDTNPVKRWWKKLTHHPQHMETRQQLTARNPDPGDDPAKLGNNRQEGTQYPNPTGSKRIDKFNDLSLAEQNACAFNPRQCISAQRHGAESLPWSESEKYFPDSKGYTGADDKRDAARHCIWMGMMTAWGDESFARDMARAHEDSDQASTDPVYARASRRMDEWNNETGIAVGLRHDDDTPAIIADCVTKARRATYIPGAAKHPNNVPPANRNTQGNDLVFFNRPHRTKRGTK